MKFFVVLIATVSAAVTATAGSGSVCAHKGWTGTSGEIKAEFDRLENEADDIELKDFTDVDEADDWEIRFSAEDKFCIGWKWDSNTHTYTSTDTWSNPALVNGACAAQATAFQKDTTVYSGTWDALTGTERHYRNCFEVVEEPDLEGDIGWIYTVKTYTTAGVYTATDASLDVEIEVTMGL